MSSRTESEALVRSWGFKTVFTWTDGSYSLPFPPPPAAFLPSLSPFSLHRQLSTLRAKLLHMKQKRPLRAPLAHRPNDAFDSSRQHDYYVSGG